MLAKARAAGARTFAVIGEHAPALAADEIVRTCAAERAETHTVSYLTALAALGRMLGLDLSPAPRLLDEALALPAPVEEARLLAGCDRLLLTGFGIDAIAASEGALKLKEATFQWAEGMAVEQALHGPHAALRKGMGAIVIPPARDDAGRTAALTALWAGRPVDIGTDFRCVANEWTRRRCRLGREPEHRRRYRTAGAGVDPCHHRTSSRGDRRARLAARCA